MVILSENKKARFEYQILQTWQAGLSLSGKMVKAIKSKNINLNGLYIIDHAGKLQVVGAKIGELAQDIPLLLNKKEIREIQEMLKVKGLTCIILNFKLVDNFLKSDIAVVKGKTLYNKRSDIKKRDLDRESRRGVL